MRKCCVRFTATSLGALENRMNQSGLMARASDVYSKAGRRHQSVLRAGSGFGPNSHGLGVGTN
jgi:hypothetical protein